MSETLSPAALAALLLDSSCRALAHPGRRAIIRLLADCGPLSMRRLRASFPGVTRSALSQQLALLQQAGLLSALPRQRRTAPDSKLPLEQQALQALAQSAVDGREQHYALNLHVLAVTAAWLNSCLTEAGYAGPAAGVSNASSAV